MQTDNTGIGASLTVSEILDAYLKEHVAHKVVDTDRQEYGARHLKAILGDRPLVEIDIPACREYTKKRRPAADSTIRRELGILNAAAKHAHRWRKIGVNQLPQIELPEVAESDKVKWFEKDQIAAMFRARNSGFFACFLRITYYTAARRDSIERLLKTQVDRNAGVIHLAQPGEKKTKKRRPTVPLYPEIRPAVDWLFDKTATPYLFGRQRDFYKPFILLMEELGLEGHPHMLRHSRATHMLQDGESLFKVSKLLGDTTATVEKVYAHATTGFLASDSGVVGDKLVDAVKVPNAGQFKPEYAI